MGAWPNMALQRTRRPRLRSGRSLCSLGSPLNARPLAGRTRIAGRRALIAGAVLAAGCASSSQKPDARPVPVFGPDPASCVRLQPPKPISRPSPRYPAELRRTGFEGTVGFEAVVNADGSVTDVKLIQATDSEFTKLVFEAVRRWRYRPALCDGVPIKVYLSASVNFQLNR